MGPRSLLVVFFCLLVSVPTPAQHGAFTAPVPFDVMVQQASVIVRGHIVAVRVEPHPQYSNLKTVVVTVHADRILKGGSVADVTFRQFIWDARDVSSAAGYRKKDEILLFLNPTSSAGLTSPVGLGAGRFRISRDQKGNAFALNERGNAGIANEISTRTRERGIELSRESQSELASAHGAIALTAIEEAIVALEGQRQ